MAVDRKAQYQALVEQRRSLKAKYPPDVYARLTLEPDDILAYVRAVIRYGPTPKENLDLRCDFSK